MDELYQTLRQVCERRRSVRDFADRPVSPEAIEKIKAIAYTSPYASGRKNWEILVVDDRATIQQMAEVVRRRSEEVKRSLRDDFLESYSEYAKYYTFFEQAPVLLIPVFRISPTLSYMQTEADPGLVQWERDNYVKSIACVAMLILLAAESLGLGGCFMTGPLLAEADLGKIVKIKPGRHIGAIIPVGYSGTL